MIIMGKNNRKKTLDPPPHFWLRKLIQNYVVFFRDVFILIIEEHTFLNFLNFSIAEQNLNLKKYLKFYFHGSSGQKDAKKATFASDWL